MLGTWYNHNHYLILVILRLFTAFCCIGDGSQLHHSQCNGDSQWTDALRHNERCLPPGEPGVAEEGIKLGQILSHRQPRTHTLCKFLVLVVMKIICAGRAFAKVIDFFESAKAWGWYPKRQQ